MAKVTRALEKANRVREMGFWGSDKVWNCKQDPLCTPQSSQESKEVKEQSKY